MSRTDDTRGASVDGADGRRNGYRFDHVFVSEQHRGAVVDCRYGHSVRTSGLTDHSALVTTLDLADNAE
jgi:exodeoxyribonuclease-3